MLSDVRAPYSQCPGCRCLGLWRAHFLHNNQATVKVVHSTGGDVRDGKQVRSAHTTSAFGWCELTFSQH